MIEVDWDDPEHSILCMTIRTPWTEEEYTAAHWHMFEMAEGNNSRLDLINIVHLEHGPPPENMISAHSSGAQATPPTVCYDCDGFD
jgi:hypothetical protein